MRRLLGQKQPPLGRLMSMPVRANVQSCLPPALARVSGRHLESRESQIGKRGMQGKVSRPRRAKTQCRHPAHRRNSVSSATCRAHTSSQRNSNGPAVECGPGAENLPVARNDEGRCRLHDGASGSGGFPGERNGQYRHGEPTRAPITERRKFSALLKCSSLVTGGLARYFYAR